MILLLSGWVAMIAPESVTTSSGAASLAIGGYVEAYYSYNFARPARGATALRGFDNRHDTITLSNVALDLLGTIASAYAHVTLQVGHTPNTYYLAEPSVPASDGVGESSLTTWRFLQQAYGGAKVEIGVPLEIEAGLFTSPIGPETIPVKDNWNFSRSNLFYGLPFYHTAVRATARLEGGWALMLMVSNGWNTVLDNNDSKSIALQLSYTAGPTTAAVLYFGGPERPTGAPEGPAWRHLFDLLAQVQLIDPLAILAHFDSGFEPGRLGTSWWAAGALAARLQIVEPLFFAVRGDLFAEGLGHLAGATASPIFWPTSEPDRTTVLGSLTATIDFRPWNGVSLRLEGRHDRASTELYAGREGPRSDQTTVTTGAVAWF